MASFTVRVELHNAGDKDYETLHAAMARKGFSRQIRSDDGNWYHLPSAEYDYAAQESIDQVRPAAATAAGTTGRTFAVLVTEAGKRSWQGLALVR
jgi:hypothetical protein